MVIKVMDLVVNSTKKRQIVNGLSTNFVVYAYNSPDQNRSVAGNLRAIPFASLNMLKKAIAALALTSGIGALSFASPFSAAVSAQSNDYRKIMEEDSFSLWNSGESQGVAFNVWKRKGKAGGGFYYFLWKAPYAKVADRGDPEVVVFFDSNIAQLNSEYLVDCYQNGDSGSVCEKPDKKPVHYRYSGTCIFPWQVMADGNACGKQAAIARPGQFE